jgi:hypothetical protein
VSAVRCEVKASATDRSLVQRSPTECDVSEYDLETSTVRRARPNRSCRTLKKKVFITYSKKFKINKVGLSEIKEWIFNERVTVQENFVFRV